MQPQRQLTGFAPELRETQLQAYPLRVEIPVSQCLRLQAAADIGARRDTAQPQATCEGTPQRGPQLSQFRQLQFDRQASVVGIGVGVAGIDGEQPLSTQPIALQVQLQRLNLQLVRLPDDISTAAERLLQ